jgi:uncharacterized lipoprotein YddW (UPF0748 family)
MRTTSVHRRKLPLALTVIATLVASLAVGQPATAAPPPPASTTIDATDPTPASNPAGVDPTSGRCYPGCRGAEQLIVYTTVFGASTGTNDFGFEVTVANGRVASRGGSNSVIPAGGSVISGHGDRGTWLSTNAVLGAAVAIAGSTLTITVDASTYILGAQAALTRAQGQAAAAKESCLTADLPGSATAAKAASALLERAKAAESSGDAEAAIGLATQSRESAELASYRTAESRPVEGRGVWVRPTETTPEAIRATLDRIRTSGFNMVFLETVWQGYTIYPSAAAASYGIAAQRPNMVGFDPLRVWIDEAHARGIELHPWVHTFFVGVDSANDGVGPVLKAHPEWAAVEREDVGKAGPQPSSQEVGYYFVDPSMAGPRAYVKSLYTEILTKYNVDGIHLDYIRYPVSQPWQTASFSYSDHARAAFAAEFGADPYTLTPDDALWQSWNSWREKQVTSFVAEVREMQKRVAPHAQVSAAVFPSPTDGLAKKFQNWSDWVKKGYVDVLTGMSFGTSAESVAADTAMMRSVVGDGNLLYTATYAPFRGSTPDVMLDQVQAVRDAGSDGAALFAYNQLSAPQATALAEGSFRVAARVPHADLVGAAGAAAAATALSIRGAAGVCAPPAVAAALSVQLAAARTWLRLGKPDRAATAFAGAVALTRASTTLQPAFGSRLIRDLEMYERWSKRAASQG